MASACAGARSDRVVWIDVFAVRQWPGNVADLGKPRLSAHPNLYGAASHPYPRPWHQTSVELFPGVLLRSYQCPLPVIVSARSGFETQRSF